jgi:hypothetical protein
MKGRKNEVLDFRMVSRIVPHQSKTNERIEVMKQAESNTCRLFSIRVDLSAQHMM